MKKLFLNPAIILTASLALLTISTVSAATHYVNVNGANATPPYTNWITAATNIQDAVSVASAGGTILVTNGVYPGTVDVTSLLTLVSVNGPQFTVINGGGTNRCVSLTTNGASLTGFTLTNGAGSYRNAGGGAYCSSTNVFLTNCVITGNSAVGVWTIVGGGGPWGRYPLYRSASAGGVYAGTLYNCTLTGNSSDRGGGAVGSTLYNCTLIGNRTISASFYYNGQWYYHYGVIGGADSCGLYNCIVYNNSGNSPNYGTSGTLNHCCTTPLPTNGVGNITNAPLFVNEAGGNLRLQTNSPGINAGNNDYVTTTTDLDGNPRIAGGTVDMGAYEFQPCITGGQFCDTACSSFTGFSFTFSGAIVGQPYRIQTSAHLAAGSWTDLTNFIYTGPIVITDPSAAGPKKFYRAVSP